MSVHQKRDGRWFAVWIDPKTRRQRARMFGRGPEAERAARDFNSSIPSRRYEHRTPTPGSATFSDLANSYAESRVGIMEKVSLDNWLWKMRGIIFPALGHLRAMDITPARLDRYVKARLSTLKKNDRPDLGTIKRTTVHRELSDIRAVLNWAARRRYIPFNPAAAYEMPKRDDAIILPPTINEISAIVRVAPEHLARAIVISYYTGLRPGPRELFSLNWSDVDFDSGTITVRSARKGGSRWRIVPIHRAMFPLLTSWRSADHITGDAHDAPIIHFAGQRIASIKKAYITAKRRAGIARRLPLYALRHAFATETLRGSADLKSVSALLGHTRTDTTTRIYQHINTAQTRDAVERLPALDVPVNEIGQSIDPERRTIH